MASKQTLRFSCYWSNLFPDSSCPENKYINRIYSWNEQTFGWSQNVIVTHKLFETSCLFLSDWIEWTSSNKSKCHCGMKIFYFHFFLLHFHTHWKYNIFMTFHLVADLSAQPTSSHSHLNLGVTSYNWFIFQQSSCWLRRQIRKHSRGLWQTFNLEDCWIFMPVDLLNIHTSSAALLMEMLVGNLVSIFMIPRWWVLLWLWRSPDSSSIAPFLVLRF